MFPPVTVDQAAVAFRVRQPLKREVNPDGGVILWMLPVPPTSVTTVVGAMVRFDPATVIGVPIFPLTVP